MIGRLSGTLLIEIWQDITPQTSSQWRAGSHQRFWRVCLHPRFPGGSCRSCSLAQRHLVQRGKKRYILKSTVILNYMYKCVCVCFLVLVCVRIPVALAYTTLARGSLFWRSSTALPIFVDVAFLALWHSSKIIWGEKVKGKQRTHGVLICVRCEVC